MRALVKFLSLDGYERLLVCRTFALVWILSVSLRVLPFAIAQRLFASRIAPGGRMRRQHPMERLLWAIDVASRYVPGASCLSLALAGRMMLNREGYPAHIHIGVAKDQASSFFAAHAWLESEGKIVVGGHESSLLFVPLGVIGEGNPR